MTEWNHVLFQTPQNHDWMKLWTQPLDDYDTKKIKLLQLQEIMNPTTRWLWHEENWTPSITGNGLAVDL